MFCEQHKYEGMVDPVMGVSTGGTCVERGVTGEQEEEVQNSESEYTWKGKVRKNEGVGGGQ